MNNSYMFAETLRKTAMDIQQKFFEMAKSKLMPGQNLADILCKTLDMAADSAYRRISGKTDLSLKELAILCPHFKISLDALVNNNYDNILFRYTPMDLSNTEHYYTYIEGLLDVFNTVSRSAEKEICFMALDIPGPHFMPFPDLMLFKLYNWFRTANASQISYEDFVSQLDVPRLSATFEQIGNAYSQIPSTEVWTKNAVSPLLKLLEHSSDLHCFKQKETFHRICHQAVQLINNIEKYTSKEEKEYRGETAAFRMYVSSGDITNDVMITKYNGLPLTSIKIYTINGIFTSNESFCAEMEKWMEDTIGKSLLMNATSTYERFCFFHEIKDKIYHLLEKLEKQLA